ncbi:hypothetical protein POV27_04830 [Aureisphaera galaxeae]|uniref:hypothetical protein n=1 Tax=Aureisphaera galaxeae TaxID=1538023 RepID=UPI0023501513|nr:hypothetical protein [Aureisphaera galaxeae]MDC8003362.1 hypothetical protein [Aureisphaera galaxeae]
MKNPFYPIHTNQWMWILLMAMVCQLPVNATLIPPSNTGNTQQEGIGYYGLGDFALGKEIYVPNPSFDTKSEATSEFISGGTPILTYTTGTYNVSSASFVDTFSVAAQDGNPMDMLFNDDGTKLYVLGLSGDDVNEYDLSTPYDVSTGTFVDTFSISGQEANPTGMAFNDDGTKLYIVGLSSDAVHEYDLGVACDVSTGVFLQSFFVSAQESNPEDVAFNKDGTKMYVLGSTGDDINEYDLSTAFDISTAVSNDTFSVGGQDTFPTGMSFNNDGTQLFVTGDTGADVNHYILSIPFDVSTATFVTNFLVSGQDFTPEGIAFNRTGSKMYVVGNSGNDINEYDLSTISNYLESFTNDGSINNTFPLQLELTGDTFADLGSGTLTAAQVTVGSVPAGLIATLTIINPNTVELTFSGNATDHQNVDDLSEITFTIADSAFTNSTVAQVSIPLSSGVGINFIDNLAPLLSCTLGSYDVTTASFVDVFSVSSQESAPRDMSFNHDGTKLYVLGAAGVDINEYDLSTAYDVSTGTFVGTFSVSAQETAPTGMAMNSEGTVLYVVGTTTDTVYMYTMSTAFDISTASFFQSFSISAQEVTPQDVTFNNAGTKMYITGSTGDDIDEYDLSTAFDISTASFVSSFSVSGEDTEPTGLVFNHDGSEFFVIGEAGNDVNQYSLSTPFDVSTATFVTNFSVGGQDGNPEGIAFNRSGSKMYVVGDAGNDINEYDLGTISNYLESFTNDGSVNNSTPLQFELTGDTFADLGSGALTAGQVTINNVPAGLTATLSILTPTTAELTFSGNATDHQDVDDVGEITFTFDDTAFTNSTAAQVAVPSCGVGIDFTDNISPALSCILGPLELFNTSFTDTFSVAAQATDPQDISFNHDGTKLYVVGFTSDAVDEYDLSTPYDVSTGTFVDSFSVSGEEGNATGMAFNNAGTLLFIVGTSSDTLYMYTLAIAYDVSTGVLSQSFSIGAQEATPQDVAFNKDGTKMYIVGNTGDDINEYDLSSPFDISTVVFNDTFSVATQETNPTGVAFNNDGTQLFVSGDSGNDVNQYTLSTPFDVSTGTFVTNFSVNSEDGSPGGIAFNSSYSKMYIVGGAGDDINEYDLVTIGDYLESLVNDGSINNGSPLRLELTGDTFVDLGSGALTTGQVTINNVPTGLTATLAILAPTTVELTFSGNSASHEDIDDVTEITFTFDNTAFTNSTAAQVAVPSCGIGIDFIGPEICGDGIDNDLDGKIDALDEDCPCDPSASGGLYTHCSQPFACTGPVSLGSLDFEASFLESGSAIGHVYVADIDGDGNTEIIHGFESIIDGQTKAIEGSTPINLGGLADVDGDGGVEFFDAGGSSHRFRSYDTDGTLLFNATVASGLPAEDDVPLFADFNHDGIPEAYLSNKILNAQTGALLLDAGAGHRGIPGGLFRLSLPVAADVIGDDTLELIAGHTVYSVNITNTTGTAGNTITPITYPGISTSDGLTFVADMDLDGALDVITANTTTDILNIWNPRTGILMSSALPGDLNLSRTPTIMIGNVDDDPYPEIATLRSGTQFSVFDYDGNSTLSVKWTDVVADTSSEWTGATMFDFNADGKQEVVYRDEVELHVYDAETGIPFYTFPLTSNTRNEYPVIADVDDDGEAEILITGNGASGTGLYLFESGPLSTWASARNIWNQYTYRAVSINSDATVPQYETNASISYTVGPDTFRPYNISNVQVGGLLSTGQPVTLPLPDASVTSVTEQVGSNCTGGDAIIQVNIDNLGDADLPAGTPIAVYDGDPQVGGAVLLTVGTLSTSIAPGGSGSESISVPGITLPTTIYVLVSDDGTGTLPLTIPTDFPLSTINECDYTNNLGNLAVTCADTDNDTIPDSVDIDDDNDGILDLEECPPPVPIVGADGTFESLAGVASGDVFNSNVTGGGWINGVGSADSWVSPMPTIGTGVWGGMADGMPSSPDGGVFAGAWSNGGNDESFYTDVTSLVVGQTYSVVFYQGNAGIEGTTAIGTNMRWRVDFGSTTQYSSEMPYLGEGNQVWQEEALVFTATATTMRLEFFSDPGSDGSAQLECMAVDGIRVFEGAFGSGDTDTDGIVNCLDLDSDNDGISDLYESGFANPEYDTNNDGTISIAEAEAVLGAGNADLDGDGLMDIFDADTGDSTPIASIGTIAVDTDTDGVNDFIDLDSDADGIPDTVEAFPTPNFATNYPNDGDVTDDDNDGDGVIALFDADDATGDFGGDFMTPVNTDGVDNPDFLDTDSDNDTIPDSTESGLTLSSADANGDGIDDDASIGASYSDPNGAIDDPSATLDNEIGDTSEVAYREVTDTDNDTIPDSVDIDDDNDGILDIQECPPPVPIVGADGTFESLAGVASGDVFNSNVTGGGWINGVGSADSWVSPMPTIGTGVWGGMADGMPSSPDGGVFAGAWSNGGNDESFYTDVTSLVVGQTYSVVFYQGNAGIEGTTAIGTNMRWRVDFGSTTQYSSEMPYLGEGNQVWQEEALVFTATATTMRLEFFSDPGSDGSAQLECMAMDGIRMFEGTFGSGDTDTDGIDNCLDLDSDNDGISDFYESGYANLAHDTNNDGTISIAEAEAVLGAGNADLDGDGLMDIFDADTGDITPTASIGTVPVDTDTDTVNDFIDLDSDADGIPDTVEAFPTPNFATNYPNDGDVTDDDNDGDGVIALFDADDATGDFGGDFMTPVNTDGVDNPDYLDTDSDNDTLPDSTESGLTLSGNDANGDGIDDDASIGASYSDPNGVIDDPSATLDNQIGDTSEVAYRETGVIDYMRHGKYFMNNSEQPMEFGKGGN